MKSAGESQTIPALELSIIPAILASSCCLTAPALTLVGISFAERLLQIPDWILRIVAVFVLFLSILVYLFFNGIRTSQDYREQKKVIVLLISQTIVFAVLLYAISLFILVPALCSFTGVSMCSS